MERENAQEKYDLYILVGKGMHKGEMEATLALGIQASCLDYLTRIAEKYNIEIGELMEELKTSSKVL